MPEPVIRRQLRCVQCGYDLEGLSPRSACPECGNAILASLAQGLDLDESARARTAPSKRAAWALFAASVGCLAASARLPEFVVVSIAGELASPRLESLRAAASSLAALLHLAALFGAATGLVALAVVLPRQGETRVLRVRVLGAAGFALWLAIALPRPNLLGITVAALPAAMVLLAISPLLRELGPRSRVYRNRGSAKQRIDELLIALGIAAAASVCSVLVARDGGNETLVALLRIVATSSAGLFVIGLGYLALNAYWILRAVLRPDPTLDEVIGFGAPRDASRKPRP